MPIDWSGAGALIRKGSPFYFDWVGPEPAPRPHRGRRDRSSARSARMASPSARRSRRPVLPLARRERGRDLRGLRACGQGRHRCGRDVDHHGIGRALDPGHRAHGRRVLPRRRRPRLDRLADTAQFGAWYPAGTPPPARRTGDTRTLLDGEVITFDWSPDGKTIAAIRIVPTDAPTPGASGGQSTVSSSPAASASPAPSIRSTSSPWTSPPGGSARSPRSHPRARYVNQVLSTSTSTRSATACGRPKLVAARAAGGETGATRTDVFYPDGGDPEPLDAEIGFWTRERRVAPDPA